MGDMITSFILESGFANMGIKSIIMILVACVFLYLDIKMEKELLVKQLKLKFYVKIVYYIILLLICVIT